ncbi:hypothetical protein [Urbifossiella limnaea]|uniref:Uncharacterized protein n=1 Tax=Urbifossiella limnaea TaxID=2528023 RepID=A0A517XVP6_9BACT|nr:hypothetical protein [Urbifossiella limnaea]QDU21557.1 hypothetical protein ETAA1_35260 [Urbifossiella limnaea]
MSPADLIREHGLRPNDLVVHAGAGGVELLSELRGYGCRVLRLDPDAVGWDADVDTLRAELSPAVERLVRERYGPAALVLVAGVVVDRATRPTSRAA